MAKSMSTFAKWIATAAYCSLLIASTVMAQTTPDPTRPPDSIGISTGHGEAIPAASGPVLQSVIISEHSKIAIISGKTVKLHQKFGEFRLVKVSETEVILQNGKEQQVLKLFPDIQKKSVNKSTP